MSVTDKTFNYIEHTADTGIVSYGMTLNEVFIHAAEGMFNLITDPDGISPAASIEVEVKADDKSYETLLVEWLNELLYRFDTDHMLFSHFNISSLSPDKLRAHCSGERIDLSRHSIKTEIKAATYHMLAIKKTNGGYQAKVIFDL